MTKHSLSHRILDEQIRNKSNNYKHPTYVTEHKLLEAIRHANNEAAMHYLDEINSVDRPVLADHPIRSLKNNLIGRCTMSARAAIQGGAVAETSFILADIMIRDIEERVSITKLEALEYDMVQFFVELVSLSRHENYSAPVNKAIRFIRENLQTRLTLKDIAREADVSPNYLSNLFSREVSEPPISGSPSAWMRWTLPCSTGSAVAVGTSTGCSRACAPPKTRGSGRSSSTASSSAASTMTRPCPWRSASAAPGTCCASSNTWTWAPATAGK